MAGSSDGPSQRRPRVAVVALGCRVSRADADALAARIAGRCDLVDGRDAPDVVVVNTCAITADAESAARQAIRRAAREHPRARIVAAGCCAEVCPDALAALPGVTAVVGAGDARSLPEAVALAAGVSPLPMLDGPEDATWAPPAVTPQRHTRPFLKVQDGCDARCAFCVVPLARGRSRSMPFEDALARIAALGARHAEVVITGVHLGAYGRDLAPRRSLADLVRAAVTRRHSSRLRLSSVEPLELPLELLRDPEVTPALCPHFHLPLQTGSARLLAAMRRPYGPAGYARVVEEVARAVSGACLAADVIVGFPGETEADHRQTVALVEALPLAALHVFPFSPRRGTAAASLPGALPADVVRARAGELRALSERRWRAFLTAQAGRELEVVVERIEAGIARGTAREYVTVRWPAHGEVRGALVRVRVEANDGVDCTGTRVRGAAPGAATAPP